MTGSRAQLPYEPDYAPPTGQILEEYIEALGISQAEFARRCGRSGKLISEILAGVAPVESSTALQFERITGLSARIWMGIESDYRLFLDRKSESEALQTAQTWAVKFPWRDLVKKGMIADDERMPLAERLLAFFGVASPKAWEDQYGRLAVCARHSRTFASTPEALATWVRVGELEAKNSETAPFDKNVFYKACVEIRKITKDDYMSAIERAKELCASAGVVYVVVPNLTGTAISGAAWWLSPKKAIIQQSLRHKSDDHHWFSFFHEAGHILKHSHKSIFLDAEGRTSDDDVDKEADEFAEEFLVPRSELDNMLRYPVISKALVRECADRLGVAPGIVVGALQHRGVVPWNSALNALKVYYGDVQ